MYYPHTSFGKIVYDPPRGKMKRKTKWWAVVDVDREITRYFRYIVLKTHDVILHQPSWDAHISIIRGEQPSNDKIDLWKKYCGDIVQFEYSNVVRQNGHYWFVDIDCPKLKDIRKEFGLPYDWTLHLTIGRTY